MFTDQQSYIHILFFYRSFSVAVPLVTEYKQVLRDISTATKPSIICTYILLKPPCFARVSPYIPWFTAQLHGKKI